MRVNKKKYQSIWTDGENRIFIIDQTLLPYNFRELELKTAEDAAKAISLMQVRGAPLIGVTAALAFISHHVKTTVTKIFMQPRRPIKQTNSNKSKMGCGTNGR